MASPAGLTVTVSPSASAFFAGEVFTASITFRNTATPLPEAARDVHVGDGGETTTPHGLAAARWAHPPQRAPARGHARAASTAAALSSWAGPPSGPAAGANGAFSPSTPPRDTGLLHGAYASPPSSSNGRTVSSGHAPHPSLSASASTLHLPTLAASTNPAHGSPTRATGRTLPRSPSAASYGPAAVAPGPVFTAPGSYDPDAEGDLPFRKGLIGKPPAPADPSSSSSTSTVGLYSGGPRRPGAVRHGSLGHARTQSMAAPTPNSPVRGAERPVGLRSVTAPNSAPNRPGAPRRSSSVRGLVAAFEQMDGRPPRSPSDARGEHLLFPPARSRARRVPCWC